MAPVGSRASRASALCLALAGAAVALFGVLPGCTSASPEPIAVIVPTDPNGVLVVEWTLRGTIDPADCELSGATSILIHVVTIDAIDAGTYAQGCGAFSTSIPLARGSYEASAVLVDAAGQPRTTSAPIPPFSILGGDVFHVPVDFPANSFF